MENLPLEKPKKVSREVLDSMVTLLLGGFGFVAALAWNDAVQSLFNEFLPAKSAGILMKFFYAALITLIITLISLRLSRYAKREKEKEAEGLH